MVDRAEDFLFSLGFKQVRVRHYQNLARIEVYPEEMGRFMEISREGKSRQPFERDRVSIRHLGSSGVSIGIDERGIEMKAIALLSGGLDSTLAAKVVLEQGIELEALNFLTVFCNCTNRREKPASLPRRRSSLWAFPSKCSMFLKSIWRS